MSIRLVYLREETTYDVNTFKKDVLAAIGEPSETESGKTDLAWLDETFLGRLKKSMDNGLASKDETTVVRKTKDGYSFRYVGLYDYVDEDEKGTERNLTFFFLPKFVGEAAWKDWEEEDRSKRGEIRKKRDAIRDTVLQAIDRYKSELSQLDNQTEETEQNKESLLELAVRVLRDYLENDVYTVQRRELEHNGQGEIDWETTIDQYQPVFLRDRDGKKPRPIYMDYATELAWSDAEHFITRLHQCLVTTWGRKLEELGLSSVLRVNVPLLSEEELDWFGGPDYQIAQIDKELKQQFVTKSRHTLSLMKDLIRETAENKAVDNQSLSFGMNGAEHLWEAACAQVLGTELDEMVQGRGLTLATKDLKDIDWKKQLGKNQPVSFKKYMPRPLWFANQSRTDHQRGKDEAVAEGDESKSDESSRQSGWRLDFIRRWPPSGNVEKLAILDAKYYNVIWDEENKTIERQPGMSDIAKQLFYQCAFQDLVSPDQIVNAFLFPGGDSASSNSLKTVRVSLGWKSQSGLVTAGAFRTVKLFAVWLPGIELLRRYANGEFGDDWFEGIVTIHDDRIVSPDKIRTS